MSLPTTLEYGKVTGRFVLPASNDGTTVRPAQGVIDITPIDYILVGGSTPTTMTTDTAHCTVSKTGGELVGPDGNLGVWLAAGWYQVECKFPGQLRATYQIQVTGEHTEQDPLDLTLAAPITPSDTIQLVVNEQLYLDTIEARDEAIAAAASVGDPAPKTALYQAPTGGDDATSIQARLDAAGPDEIVRLWGTYTLNSTIVVTKNLDASGAVFNYSGPGVAVQIGSTTAATFRKKVILPRIVCTTKPASGWAAGTVGVKVTNAYNYEISVPHIVGFEVGLLGYGENSNGTSYCVFQMGHLDNNQVNLRLSAGLNGWCNQNTFIGGRWSHNSNEGSPATGATHLHIDDITPHSDPNNNVWLNPSIESPNVAEWTIDAAGGSYNVWVAPRFEYMGGDARSNVRWGASAVRNTILYGNQAENIDETHVAGSTLNQIQAAGKHRFYVTGEPGMVLENNFSSTAPALTMMRAGGTVLGDNPTSGYVGRFTANDWRGKRHTDANARIIVDALNGRFYAGNGVAPADSYWTGSPGNMILGSGSLVFLNDNTQDIGGASSLRPRYVRAGTALRTGSFPTGSRPAAATAGAGAHVWDSTLGKPVWSDGAQWREVSTGIVYRGTGADQTAFSTLLSTLPAGAHVRVVGSVSLTGTVTISADDVTLELDPGATITTTVAASDAILVTGQDVTIRGGSIVSPATFDGTNVQPTFAVVRSTAPGLLVDDVTLVNVPKVGIFADETDDLAVVDCRIEGNYPAGSWTGVETGHFGVAVNPSTSGRSGRTIVRGNLVRGCVQGVYLGNYGATATGAYGPNVTGNIFDGCHNHGIYNAGGVDAVTVGANSFTRCSLPVALTGSGHSVTGNTMFTHGTGNNLDLIGISLREPKGCTVTGNTLRGDAPTGSVVIELGNYAAGSVEVSGNVVSGNTIEMTGGTSVGIRIGRSNQTEVCHDNIVADNVLRGTGSPNVGLITLAPLAGAAARGNKITDNTIVVRGESYGIYVGVSQHTVVQNNTIRFEYTAGSAKTLAGIMLAAATRAMVVGNDISNTPGFGTNVTLRGLWEITGTSGCTYAQNRHDPATGLTGYTDFVAAAGSNPNLEDWILPTGSGDDTAHLNSYLTAGVAKSKRLIGAFTVTGTVNVPAGVHLDASGATITQTGTNVTTISLAGDGASISGGELVGKGTDYVVGGTISANGIATNATTGCRVTGVTLRDFAGAAIRATATTSFTATGFRVVGVGEPTITEGDGGSCYGVYLDTGAVDTSITDADISAVCQGVIAGLSVTDLTLENLRIHDVPGQHGVYVQNGTGLTVDQITLRDVHFNGMKLQLSVSSAADSAGATIRGINATRCGDTALSVNNTATDLTSAKKIRGLSIDDVTAVDCGRTLYLGSIRGGVVRGVAGYDTALDGLTVLDCQDLEIAGVTLDVVGRIGVRLTTATGADTSRVRFADVSIRNAANANEVNNTYGVYLLRGSYVTFDGLTVTADNGTLVHGFFCATGTPSDQETLSLRNVDLSGDTGTSARFHSTPTAVRDWTNVRMSGSLLFTPTGVTARKGALSGATVDVSETGAVGDGTTNDQQAIATAHGVLPGTGGLIVTPPGVFRMSTRLIMSKPGVTIRGAGPDATTLLIDAAAFQVGANDVLIRDLTIKGSNGVLTRLALQAITTGGQWKNWRFENVKFDGVGIAVTRIGATDTNGNAVTTGSDLAEHVEFDRCEFTAYTPDGFLWVQGTHHVSVDRCWFHDSGTSTTVGDQFKASYGARYWRVSGSTFERSTRDAIDCYDASRGIVENNTIVNPGVHGIDTKFVNAAASNATDLLIVRGNRVVNAGAATASPAMQLSVDGVLAEGNIIEGGSGTGLRCGSSTDGSVRSKDATWTGNRVIGTASYGFFLTGCDGAIVAQNTATDCLNSGFHIAAATNSDVVVGHNRSARNSAADVVEF